MVEIKVFSRNRWKIELTEFAKQANELDIFSCFYKGIDGKKIKEKKRKKENRNSGRERKKNRTKKKKSKFKKPPPINWARKSTSRLNPMAVSFVFIKRGFWKLFQNFLVGDNFSSSIFFLWGFIDVFHLPLGSFRLDFSLFFFPQ